MQPTPLEASAIIGFTFDQIATMADNIKTKSELNHTSAYATFSLCDMSFRHQKATTARVKVSLQPSV